MKIGVSAWRLFGQRLGVGRYIEYLLKYWTPVLQPADRVTVFVHEPFDPTPLSLSEAFSSRIVRPRMTNALWENLLLPRAARDVDVLFGPSYTLPLTFRGRSVVVLHSVDDAQAGVHSLRHRLTYSQKYRLSARRADKVIVNSQSSVERVRDEYGVPSEKIEVIWLGADYAFRPLDDQELLRQTRVRYFGANRPYILFAGGLSKRRNVPMLLEAFALLKHRYRIPHGLLFVGPNRGQVPLEMLAQHLGISDSIVHTDGLFASHHELVPIYNAAELFVLPSSSEGFSLTLAEAMSCGTPVVTVNVAALGEVAHGYGLTIDVPDVDALAAAMYKVITDPETSRTLRAAGLARARLLRWDTTARRTLDVLRQVTAQ